MRPGAWLAAAALLATPGVALAYGEPDAAGVPNPQERLTHVYTNQIRQAPHAWPGWNTALATPAARKPLAMIPGLYSAARFHADDMAANGCFQHESCDGTPFETRIARYFDGPSAGENIYSAVGIPGAAAALTGWMNSDGHRVNILRPEWNALGTGFADAGQVYYVQDFGVASVSVPPIPAAAFESVAGGLRVVANYYDPTGKAPARLEAVLGEAHLALSRVAGADGNETLDATAAAPTGCVPLYFVAEAAGGAQTAFPTSGALLVGPTCTADYTTTRTGGPIGGGGEVIDANDPGGCRCARPARGASWLAWLALALPALGRRRRAHRR